MIIGIFVYSTGEIKPIEYNDKYFTIYNTKIQINGFLFNYCYNYIANYLFNQCNNINKIINNIYGNVYIFKLNDLNEFITFNNNEMKHIINQFTCVL
jgi:hypothetical protein